MTNPDTPREAEVRSLFGTLSTEQQETLTSARAAIDRSTAAAEALRDKVVDDETFAELNTDAEAMVTALNDAQDAFDKVGVPAQPVSAKKKAK